MFEPGDQAANVALVLVAGVRGSTVGVELDKERLESGLEVHATMEVAFPR